MSPDEHFDVATFCKESYPHARRVAYPLGRLLGLDDSTIDDAIQDAYVVVLASVAELEARAPDHRMGNLCVTVRNKVLTRFDHLHKRRLVTLDRLGDHVDTSSCDIENSVERLAADAKVILLWKALPYLQKSDRMLLALLIVDIINCGDDWSAADRHRRIAKQTGQTEGAVRAGRHRAVAALRRAMARLSEGKEELW